MCLFFNLKVLFQNNLLTHIYNMSFKNLILTIVIGAAFTACGSGNSATAEQKQEGMTEFNAGGPVEYTNNATITPDAKLPIVIDFNATWCGPCQRFAPTFEAVAKEMQGKAIFMSVNVDNSPVAAQQFEVSAIPQISILMPDGTVTSTVGYMEKDQFLQFLAPISK